MNVKHSEEDLLPEGQKELPKLTFSRLEYALNKVVSIAIPLHVRLLHEQSVNIEHLLGSKQTMELRSAQLQASNSVKLLKQDLFELANLNRYVRDGDQDRFQKIVVESLKSAVDALSSFMSVHSDVLDLPLYFDTDTINHSTEISELACEPFAVES